MSELDEALASVQGSEEGKRRLRVILETCVGTRTDEEACAILGVNQDALVAMRDDALQAMIDAMSSSVD